MDTTNGPSQSNQLEQVPHGNQPDSFLPEPFMLYRADLIMFRRHPEICTIERSISQQIGIAGKMWEQESKDVTELYEARRVINIPRGSQLFN